MMVFTTIAEFINAKYNKNIYGGYFYLAQPNISFIERIVKSFVSADGQLLHFCGYDGGNIHDIADDILISMKRGDILTSWSEGDFEKGLSDFKDIIVMHQSKLNIVATLKPTSR